MASVTTLPGRTTDGARAPAAPDILVVDDIVMEFATPDGPLVAVDHISLGVRPGEFLAVIGPSGCGKSTLFNVIGGLLDGYRGRVTVAGETVRGPHASIGMVFQEESTFPWRTVLENVAFPLEIAGMRKEARYDKARHFISLVGLNGFEKRYPAELSGGMRQRVAVARALAMQPKVLLMDEPFAALDVQTRVKMQGFLLDVWDVSKASVLFVTHHIDEAIALADRVVVFTARPGRIKAIVPIDLPRPRDLTSPALLDLRVELTALLRDEVDRAFAEQESMSFAG
jgi:NitT/TauT family transport system ATP-binding protein